MSRGGSYSDTSVPVARTQEAIRKLLQEYGMHGGRVSGFQIAEDWNAGLIGFVFQYRKKAKASDGTDIEVPMLVRMQIPLWRDEKQRFRVSAKEQQQRERQVWRALFWYLKAQLEAVAFGLRSFEDAFLSDIVLREGLTVGEAIKADMLQPTGRFGLLPAQTHSDVMDADFKTK